MRQECHGPLRAGHFATDRNWNFLSLSVALFLAGSEHAGPCHNLCKCWVVLNGTQLYRNDGVCIVLTDGHDLVCLRAIQLVRQQKIQFHGA
jgi:hypothetical protein